MGLGFGMRLEGDGDLDVETSSYAIIEHYLTCLEVPFLQEGICVNHSVTTCCMRIYAFVLLGLVSTYG